MRRPLLLVGLAIGVAGTVAWYASAPTIRSSALTNQLGFRANLPSESELLAMSFVTDQDVDGLPDLQVVFDGEPSVDWRDSFNMRQIVKSRPLASVLFNSSDGAHTVRQLEPTMLVDRRTCFALNSSGWLHYALHGRRGGPELCQILGDRNRTVARLPMTRRVFAYCELQSPDGDDRLIQLRLMPSQRMTLCADSVDSGVQLWEYPLWESAQANERITVIPAPAIYGPEHLLLVQRRRPGTRDYGASLGFDLLATETGELLDWIYPDPLADDRELEADEILVATRTQQLPWVFCTALETTVGSSDKLMSAMLINFADEEIELLPPSRVLSRYQALAQVGLLPRVAGGEFGRVYLERSTAADGSESVAFAYCEDWRDAAKWTTPIASRIDGTLQSGELIARWVDDRDGDGYAELLCAASLTNVDGDRQLVCQVISGATGDPLTSEHAMPLTTAR